MLGREERQHVRFHAYLLGVRCQRHDRNCQTAQEMLHAIYMQLFKLLFEAEEPSFFLKMIGASKRSKQEKSEQIDKLLAKLVEMSRTLLEALEMLEKEIAGLDERALAALA